MKKPSPMAGKKVLVVDDDEDLRRALIFDFKRRGCIIFEASCGNEAVKVATENRVDFVVSDIRMPNGTGVDLLKELREKHPEIPVVLLATGFADLSETEALGLGAVALLQKPIDRKKMLEILEGACEMLGA